MKLMMLDGNSIMNRAFYGIRLFSNREGLYTNAVYGFLNILLKLIEEEKPDGICAAFDVHAPTLRSRMYQEYKANRKEMPDELAVQMPVIREVLEAMRIPCFGLEGYEADDLLGTLCSKITESGMEGIVVTGDRDALQLVNDQISVMLITTSKGQTLTTVYTPEKFKEEYGFEPEKMIDLKALMGDPSDNIPGVPGIGKKTATDLVQKYGSLTDIYSKLDQIDMRGGVVDKLKAGHDIALLSFELATINKNVPLDIDVGSIRRQPFDNEKLHEIFVRLEFRSLLEKLSIEAPVTDGAKAKQLQDFVIERIGPENWNEVLEGINSPVSVVCQPHMAALAFYRPGKVYIARECDFEPGRWTDFLSIIFGEGISKYGSDIKSDIRMLLDMSIYPKGYIFDTALCAYLLNPTEGRYTIERLALSYLGIQVPSAKLYEDGSSFNSLSIESQAENAIAAHAAALFALSEMLQKLLDESDMKELFYDLELPLCTVLAEMEHCGMKVDAKKLEEFSEWLSVKIEQCQREIFRHSGGEFNINSTKILGEVLFEKLGLPPVKKTKTGYSTDIEVLEKLKGRHPIIEEIIEYRQLTKLKSTYADGLLKMIGDDGRIHTKFNMMVTATGRLSSTDPNLQNIPVRDDLGSEIRKMFVAEEGHVLIDADYSQIELRVLAHIADDKAMIQAFRENRDIHTITASQVFGVQPDEVTPELRRRAKAVNFGIVYGISDFSLAEDIGVSRGEAKFYIESYLNHYSGIKNYMKQVVESAKETGYVKTIMHRQRFLPELKSKNFNIRSFGERAALNTPIQGSAADIIKKAMLQVHRRLKAEGLGARMVLQVHDELIVEAPQEEAEVVARILTEEMQSVVELKVPLVADARMGKTWYDAK